MWYLGRLAFGSYAGAIVPFKSVAKKPNKRTHGRYSHWSGPYKSKAAAMSRMREMYG